MSGGTAPPRGRPPTRPQARGTRSPLRSPPAGPIRPATSRACPPSPKVQSIAVSPTCGSRSSISSPARTGTWVRVMSRRMVKALGDLLDLPRHVLLGARPAGPIPDLDVVLMAHHDDLLVDPRVVEQRLVQGDPARGVELRVEGSAGEEPDHLARAWADRVELPHHAIREAREGLGRPDCDAGVEPPDQNKSVGERGAELGGDVEPVLRIERVIEVPAERQSLRFPSSCAGAVLRTGVAGWGGAPPPRPLQAAAP